jgi:hypothetical protein
MGGIKAGTKEMYHTLGLECMRFLQHNCSLLKVLLQLLYSSKYQGRHKIVPVFSYISRLSLSLHTQILSLTKFFIPPLYAKIFLVT